MGMLLDLSQNLLTDKMIAECGNRKITVHERQNYERRR